MQIQPSPGQPADSGRKPCLLLEAHCPHSPVSRHFSKKRPEEGPVSKKGHGPTAVLWLSEAGIKSHFLKVQSALQVKWTRMFTPSLIYFKPCLWNSLRKIDWERLWLFFYSVELDCRFFFTLWKICENYDTKDERNYGISSLIAWSACSRKFD